MVIMFIHMMNYLSYLEVNKVIKIRWIITDVIEGISFEEFNSEWIGINGYFEMCINNQVLGFCPYRKLLFGEEGNEDILYWLSKFSDAIIQLNNGREYEIQLLSMNLTKVILKKEDKLLINLMNANTDEIIWSEQITFQEWFDEVMLNVEKFITEIRSTNEAMLNTNMIQKLIKIKDIISSLNCS